MFRYVVQYKIDGEWINADSSHTHIETAEQKRFELSIILTKIKFRIYDKVNACVISE